MLHVRESATVCCCACAFAFFHYGNAKVRDETIGGHEEHDAVGNLENINWKPKRFGWEERAPTEDS